MNIEHKDDQSKGEFFIRHNDQLLAKMTYVWAGPDKIIIDHTEVDEALKGKNAGKQMLAAAVDFAREKKIRIMPLCPFARSVFDKMKEYEDVL